MKLKSLLIFAGLLGASCSNQGQPIIVEKFFPLGPGCDVTTFEKDTFAKNANLDVAAGNPQLFVGVRVTGGDQVLQPSVKLTAIELERENRDRPLINQMVVTYRLSKRVGGTPRPYTVNMSAPFSEAGTVIMSVQLISPDLGTALFDGLIPPPGPAPSTVIDDFVDILADVEFRGEYSNSKHAFTTGILTYPIRAYRSLPVTCANGYVRFKDDPVLGAPDPCQYSGMSLTQLVVPATPGCCPSVGAPGC